jgi:hypothetical protein
MKRWKDVANDLPKLMRRLKSSEALSRNRLKELRSFPEKGVYVFYEGKRPVYVGRSNRMKERIYEYGRPGTDMRGASFPVLIVRKKTGDSRPLHELMEDKKVMDEFSMAKKQIARMIVRVVEIEDQVTQAVFEIFAAVNLKTKYNDFSTH